MKKTLLKTDQNHPAIRAYCKAVREGMKTNKEKKITGFGRSKNGSTIARYED